MTAERRNLSTALHPEGLRLLTPKPTPHPVVRYPELVPGDRHILLVLEAHGGSADLGTLAGALDLSESELQVRLAALAAAGMVQLLSGRCTLLEELRARVQRDLNSVVGARAVLRSDQTVRCSGPNAGERVLRQVCREVFAPHVLRPRVPLRQVLDVQVMNTLLDEGDRAFLANASVHVDLVVEHALTERPLLVLELDGPQHERSPQLERDVRKDRILRVSGLPLLRLWTCEAQPPSEGMLRALLHWRLRGALRDATFSKACHPALYEAFWSQPSEQDVADSLPQSDELDALLGEPMLNAILGRSGGEARRDRRATLLEIVMNLRLTHNDDGVRQWFERARYTLRGESPRDILQGDWNPGDARVRLICRLAAAGGSFFAT
ncbi:DUF2726 domain-containing protein [Deinococcus aquatilis]|uniref:DUF2726 domain-containing protein n=1 Tax=Deinococcus aquatilis TaxID=519440 RepID=UPI00037CAC0B|nr:DUF2726 domain-containing protein [Deinococcus aquatilis]